MRETRATVEPAPVAERARALKEALEHQGLLPAGALDAMRTELLDQFHWHNGARVVARAWSDPAYRKRLLRDGTAACAELGFAGPEGEYIVVLEDQATRTVTSRKSLARSSTPSPTPAASSTPKPGSTSIARGITTR